MSSKCYIHISFNSWHFLTLAILVSVVVISNCGLIQKFLMAHAFQYCSWGSQGKNTEECQRKFKLPHNCTHLTRQQSNTQNSPSHTRQYVKCELPDVQAGFRKGREEPEIKLPTSVGSLKKQESFRKTSTSALLTMPKPLTVVDHSKLWKILKEKKYQTT